MPDDTDDPAGNFHHLLDGEAHASVTPWHVGLGGDPHVTREQLEQIQAEHLSAGRRGVRQ